MIADLLRSNKRKSPKSTIMTSPERKRCSNRYRLSVSVSASSVNLQPSTSLAVHVEARDISTTHFPCQRMRVLEFTVFRRLRLRSAAYHMRDSLLEYVRGSPKPPLWHCSSITQKSGEWEAEEGFSSLSRIPCWSMVMPEIPTLLHSVTKNPNPFSKVRSDRDATPPERVITTLLETSAVYTALAEVLYSSTRIASPLSSSVFADPGRLPGDICSSELIGSPGLSFEGTHSHFKAAILVNWANKYSLS